MKSFAKALGAGLVSALALLGCTGILGSFDVSTADPGTAAEGGTGEGGGSSGGDSSTMMGGDSSMPGTDASKPLMCKTGETKCVLQNKCALLESDNDNCGSCGHSCGGGICGGGKCSAVKIYDAGALSVIALGVGHGLNFFFSTSDNNQDNRLWSCPVATGCKLAPTQLATRQYEISGISSVNTTTVTFLSAPTQSTERPAIYACPPGGCPATPVSFVGDGLNGVDSRLVSSADKVFYNLGGSGFGGALCAAGACTAGPFGSGTKGGHGHTVDATNLYFIDATSRGGTIAKCALTDSACVPSTVVAGDMTSVPNLATFGGKLFWILPGRDGFNEGKLFTCDLPACATVVPVATGLHTSPVTPPAVELYADASGEYWFTHDTTPVLQYCSPGGCVGGAKDFTGPLTNPHQLTSDDNYVYWAETSAVWRRAKDAK